MNQTATGPSTTASKKKLHRSPNYPSIALSDAIQRLQDVWKQEKKASTTSEVIIRHLGYDPKSGSGIRALSALRQYGLLDESGGQYRVSELGFTLLHFPEGSPERQQALREAARKPAIFGDILAKYEQQLPSDATLTAYLLREKGFNPATVPTFIRIFRESINLAGLGEVGYSEGQLQERVEQMQQDYEATQRGEGHPLVPRFTAGQMQSAPVQTYSFALSIPRNVKATVRIEGAVTKEDVQRLKRQIEFLEEQFEDEARS